MLVPGSASPLLFHAPAGGAATAGRSVRFNSADSAYFSRVPASAGNRRTWTFSCWVKLGKIPQPDRYTLFECTVGFSGPDSTYALLNFDADGKLGFGVANGGSYTTAVFRDPSAWYHVVAAVDTTQATASDRLKLYVNGVQYTHSGYTYAQNLDTAINTTNSHSIGMEDRSNIFKLDGYLALVHFIDGQALTPSSFGETSATTGRWEAKTYAGTYSGNSFFLDFLDNSAATATTLGKDSSGLGNNWTPNNIQAAAITNTGYSVYFDGAGDRITASDSRLALGSGDWTVECYFKADAGYATQSSLIGFTSNNPLFEFDSNKIRWMTGATYGSTLTSGVWYHVAWTRSGSTGRIFLDGSLIGTESDSTNFTNFALAIGSRQSGATEFKGWISNVRIVVGTALYTSAFSRPAIPLSAVSGTKLLTCQSSTIVDNSGNSISLTTVGNTSVTGDIPSSIAASAVDSLRDHPTSAGTNTQLGGEVSGNYCTWNPLAVTPSYQASSLTNGNLDAYVTGNNRNAYSTIAFPSSGKYFFEVTLDGSFSGAPIVGVSTFTGISDAYPSYVTTPSVVYNWDGTKAVNGTTSSYGATFGAGAVIGVAVNIDTSSVTFYKNGVSQGAISLNVAGAMPHVGSAGATGTYSLNAGQRAWAYTAPSGFSPLVDTLLPTPTIALPNTVMNVVTGNFDTTKTWTVGFNPDLIWIKSRSNADGHVITDSVRGTNAQLQSNTTGAELTNTTAVTSFNSDGFTIGTYGLVSNTSTVAWCWDAGSSNATNTSGTITSTCRTNISAGFSVVSYTGTASNRTVGHGLGVAPSLIIVKNRSSAVNWRVYHSALGGNKAIFLNTTDAADTWADYWNNTAPTSTTFSIGPESGVNGSGNNMIAYCWTPVTGYSAFGSYTGNGSSDGPFVYTGFRPRWVMIKRSSSEGGDWIVMDAARGTYNVIGPYLYPNLSNAEADTALIDFTANGFKLRNSFGNFNGASSTYIYACFAESPLAYARAR